MAGHLQSFIVTRRTLWGGYALLLAVAPLLFTSSLSQSILSQIGIAIIVCLSYNMLLGQGGMLSFGHAVYSGMGAFLAIHTLNRVSLGLPLPVSLIPLAGGLASAALALLLGWVTTRKAATPFAMITFGMGELIWAMTLTFPQFFGGEAGVSGNRVTGSAVFGISYGPEIELYYLVAAYTLVCTALMFAFTRTPLGRMLNAVRDNPERVAFVGYNPHWVRFMAFVIAAFFAGISGALAALHFEIVSAEVFSGYRSGAYLLFTFVGGSTLFFGPIIGAVLMVLAFVLLPGLTQAWLLYLGLLFVLMVTYAPGGVAALLMANWQLARQGVLQRLWLHYLALTAAAALALVGAAALVEMAYHLQQSATLGSMLPFLGMVLDVHRTSSWVCAALLLSVGAGWLELSRRRFKCRLDQIAQDAGDAALAQGERQ